MAPMFFASLLICVSMTSAGPIYSVPVAYVTLRSVPENIYNHVQDTKTGEYAFGYAGGPVAREESKTADGVTRGAYSYVDAYGIVQHYRYTADDDGFRVIGTNIPTDAASATPGVLESQEVVESEAIVTEAKSATESQSRKKRSIGFSEVPVTLEAVSAPLAIATVPTASSSQSRVQIHSNLRTEIPVELVATEIAATGALPAVSVAPKAVEIVHEEVPVAVAESAAVAASSQSGFEVGRNLEADISVERVAAISAASVAIPAVQVAAKTIEVLPKAIPVAIGNSVAVATSSQSRYQIHKSSKLETSAPIADEIVHAVPVAPAVAAIELAAPKAVAAVQVAAENIEVLPKAIPVAIGESVAVATSSQSRYQIHKSSKLETSAPIADKIIHAVPSAPAVAAIEPAAPKSVAALPTAAPISVAVSLPAAESSQSRFQVHKSLKTEIPVATVPVGVEIVKTAGPLVHATPVASETTHGILSAAPISIAAAGTATSNQRRFQVHDSSNLELNVLHQPLRYRVLKTQPVIALNSLNSDNLIARSSVGVGLGVVPSPVAAYHGAVLLGEA